MWPWSIEPRALFAEERVREMMKVAEREEREKENILSKLLLEVKKAVEYAEQERADLVMEELLKVPLEDEDENEDEEYIGAAIMVLEGSYWWMSAKCRSM